MCLKIRQSLMFTGAWYHDVSPCERFQVQEMLNRLAEESVRRLEMVGTPFSPISVINFLVIVHVNFCQESCLTYSALPHIDSNVGL